MGDVSKFNGHDIKDKIARQNIANLELSKASHSDVEEAINSVNETVESVAENVENLETLFNNAGLNNNAEGISYDNGTSGLVADNVQGAIDEMNNRFVFSTEEKVVGEWIDGKPLYAKVITFTNTNAEDNIVIDLQTSVIDNVFISGDSFCKKGVVCSPVNAPNGINPLNDFGLFIAKKDTEEYVNLGVRNGSNGTGYTYYVKLLYTKK